MIRSSRPRSSTRVHVDVNLGGSYYRGYYGGFHYGYHRPYRFYRPYHRLHYWRPPFRTIYIYGAVPSVIVERPVVVRDSEPVIVESPRVYETEQQKYIDMILHSEADKRREAAEKLAEYDNIQSTAVLVDVLINDADPTVRNASAVALGELGHAEAYEALVRSAEYELDDAAKHAAETAVNTIEKKYSAEELYLSPKIPPMNTGDEKLGEYLEDLRYGNWKTRKDAADHLNDERGVQAVAALINTLINDYTDDVREEAAESLGKIGDRMALPFLYWTMDNDPEHSVQKKAKKAIEKIHDTIL